MKILVNNEIRELTIIDPKSGCEWTQDLLGNADAVGYDDDQEICTMDADQFAWWDKYVTTESDLQDRAHELRSALDDDNKARFDQDLIDAADNDYEMCQAAQLQVVEAWESNQR